MIGAAAFLLKCEGEGEDEAGNGIVNHYDYHATLFHLFGLDPKTLNYRRNGTEQFLVEDPEARVVRELLA